MTDEQICGAETTGDEPCQNPATEGDHCWIDSHGGDVSGHGRPSAFTDELAREALQAAPIVMSVAGVERAIGVGQHTIDGPGGWLEQDLTFVDEDGTERDFSSAFRRARADGETILIQGGLRDENIDTSMARFLLATSFGYKKTERREVTGDNGPLEVVINEEVVETGYSDPEGDRDE